MNTKIIDVNFNAIRDFASTDSLSDKFLVFDNYSSGEIEKFMVTDYPVKLDVTIAVLCTGGYSRIRIGHREYKVTENSFAVVMAGKILQTLEASDDLKVDILCLKDDFFEMNSDFMQVLNMANLLVENPYQSIPPVKMNEFISLMGNVKKEMKETNNIYRSQIVHNYLYILFYKSCNLLLAGGQQKKPLSRNEEIFQKFIREVELHFRQERSVEFYAEKVFLTPKYLSTVIHQLTGQHAPDWIASYAILEAKALLKSSTMTVQQISYELNFATPSHFGRYFKRHTGQAPSEYRNS